MEGIFDEDFSPMAAAETFHGVEDGYALTLAPGVRLCISCPVDYPSRSPPVASVDLAAGVDGTVRSRIKSAGGDDAANETLEALHAESEGEVVVFSFVEALKEAWALGGGEEDPWA